MKRDTRTVPRVMAALAVSLCVVSPAVLAQGTGGRVGARLTPRAAATSPSGKAVKSGTGAIASRDTSIQGAAWRADNTPIPKAILRLRNVRTGKVEAKTIANDAGIFAFTGVNEGTYLIELVSEGGKVLTVGHTFAVASGETVATFVRLSPTVPWFNGFFSNAARTVSLSAASMGVTAVAPRTVTPVSANR